MDGIQVLGANKIDAGQNIAASIMNNSSTVGNPRLARRVEAVVAMFLGAALDAVIIRYSISAALWLGTAHIIMLRVRLEPAVTVWDSNK
jgi:hypothetical protein